MNDDEVLAALYTSSQKALQQEEFQLISAVMLLVERCYGLTEPGSSAQEFCENIAAQFQDKIGECGEYIDALLAMNVFVWSTDGESRIKLLSELDSAERQRSAVTQGGMALLRMADKGEQVNREQLLEFFSFLLALFTLTVMGAGALSPLAEEVIEQLKQLLALV